MREKFHQSLNELKQRLLMMAGMSEQAVQKVITAYSNGDMNLCHSVLENEPAINRLEREIDQMALDLIAMEQPMAIDLRFIMSTIRINADLERVGDQAVNIARRILENGPPQDVGLPVDIIKIGSLASAMVRKALQSFIDEDAEAAYSVLAMDDEVDEMNRAAFKDLNTYIRERPEFTAHALNALVITKNMERVGDHATNIAEDVIFWVQGADVRHYSSRTK